MSQKQPASQIRVGLTLREMRKARGIRASQLAGQIGISADHLRSIERGRRALTDEIRVKVCRVLKIPSIVLMEDDDTDEPELAAAS